MANNELIYVVKFQADLESLKKVRDDAAKAGAGGAAPRGGSAPQKPVKDVKDLTEAEARLRLEQQARTKATLDSVKAQLAQEKAAALTGKTYQELVDINKALFLQLRGMDFEKDAAAISKLQQAYKANNDKLKEFDKSLGDNRRNVGNYKDSIIEALGGLNAFGQPVALATKGVLDQAKAFNDARKGAGGMKEAFAGLNMTLKANVIFAVVSAVVALGNALATFQPISDAIKSTVAGLQGAFQGLVNTITKGGNIFANLKEGVSASKAAVALQKEAFVLETQVIEARAISLKQIAENREIAKDENKSLQTRIQALRNAQLLTDGIAKLEKSIAEKRVQEAQKLVDIDTTNVEKQRALAEAKAQVAEADTRNYNQQREFQEQLNSLTRQQINEENQLREAKTSTYESAVAFVMAEEDIRRLSFKQRKALIESDEAFQRTILEKRAADEAIAVQKSILAEELKAAKIKAINEKLEQDLQALATGTANKQTQLDEEVFNSRIQLAFATSDAVSGLTQVALAFGKVSAKRAFEIGRAADAASATTAGILATQRAFATPPAPNYLLAGLTAAAAAGNVAKILNTKFEGGAGGVQAPRGSGASSSAPAPGISIGTVASQVGATVTGTPAPQRQTFVVQNNIDRAGIATIVREGNDELSSRGLAVSSVS